jgi:hypothetical protein
VRRKEEWEGEKISHSAEMKLARKEIYQTLHIYGLLRY